MKPKLLKSHKLSFKPQATPEPINDSVLSYTYNLGKW